MTKTEPVDWALQIGRLVQERGALTLAELATELRTSKRTASRHAQAAKAAGWVVVRPGSRGGFERGEVAVPQATPAESPAPEAQTAA